jgi:predicted aminopeptidase
MKKKIIYTVLVLFVTIAAFNYRWVDYLAHVVSHQVKVIFGKELITERLKRTDIPDAERKSLEQTLKIRNFVEKQYGLKQSTSYRSFYDLHREALGYNITVAPKLSLQPVAFRFLGIGVFDYLGFFDKTRADAWANQYRANNYDVHVSEIGGYSTLGWFEDPLYSTQLSWGEYGLARLLAHEIAHERLYYSGDTTFSELLASFIEKKIARDYYLTTGHKLPDASELARRQADVAEFAELIHNTKNILTQLYAGTSADSEKIARKADMLDTLRKKLQVLSSRTADGGPAKELLKLPEINNATLIQYHRYTPVGGALDKIYADCVTKTRTTKAGTSVYTCWFLELEKLRGCSNEQRTAWLKQSGNSAPPNCQGS